MEELRSTEVLDKEILEDARKKAQKVLKTADDTLEAQNRDWEKKTQRSVKSIQRAYEARLTKTTEEIFARLPLDKRRLRSETAEGFLRKAMEEYLRAVGHEKLLSILENELAARVKACSNDINKKTDKNDKALVQYSGLSLSEAEGLLKKASISDNWELKEDPLPREFPSIVINTQTMKITASVEGAAAALLKDKRAELAVALLGEGVLND